MSVTQILILFVTVLAVAGMVVYYLWTKPHAPATPTATAGRSQVRAGSTATIISYLVGVFVAVAAMSVVWSVVSYALDTFLTLNTFQGAWWWMRNAGGLALGLLVGFNILWYGTRYIKPGQKAYMVLVGIPFGNFGTGYAWIVPGLMSINVSESAFLQDKSGRVEEYLTSNGVKVLIECECTYGIEDPLAVQNLQGQARADFVSATRTGCIRDYVSNQTFDIKEALDSISSGGDRKQILDLIFKTKGDISKNGPTEVRDAMNKKLLEYGLRASRVQFETVLFDNTLEQAAQRYYQETLESGGLVQNADNIAAVADKLTEAVLKSAGVDRSKLSEAALMNLASTNMARAMSMEKQGGYVHNDFGGTQPPQGVMVNVGSAQTSGGGT